MCHPHSLIRAGVALLLSLAGGWAAAAPPSPAAAGWEKLWQNRNVEARALFRQALQRQPNDPVALRGLGLLSYQEDAAGAALQAWRSLYRLTPAHWTATAYWPRMVELTERTGRWNHLEAAARDLLAAPRVAPELRASARQVLAEAASRAGKTAEADRLWAQLGYLKQWRIIGPFDNVSLSGFEKPFPPERGIDFKQTYRGKDDQPLRWHHLAHAGRDGQCDVASSLSDQGANVFYMATALYSPNERTVSLRCDPTGATRLFLNGRLVLSDDTYRLSQSYMADPLQVETTLRKGWNTLLVKLADDEILRASFALRVTPPGGSDPVISTADPEKAVAAPVVTEPAPPSMVPAAVARLRKEAPAGDREAAAALALYLQGYRDFQAAVEVLRGAVSAAPSCGWLRGELSQVLDEDEQPDEARAEREQAVAHNPRLVVAVLGQLDDEEQALPPSQRLQRLKALQKSHPQSAQTLWSLAEAYSELDLRAEALKAAKSAVSLAGGTEAVTRLAAYYLMNNRKREATALLDASLKTAPDAIPFLQTRARLLLMDGNPAAAVRLYQRLLKLDPASAAVYHLQMAELHRSTRDLKGAIRSLRLARQLRPQDAHLITRLADLLQETGQTKEAISLYRAAVRQEPSQVRLREKLQLLSGEKPVLDRVPPTPAEPILAGAPKGLPGASSMVLLDECRQVVYPDYANVMRGRLIIKVFDASAVERYQQFPLPGGSVSEHTTVERARIIKADGKVQNAGGWSVGTSVALPSLAPGDTIDVSYRVDQYPSGGLARQFWTQWHFTDHTAPVRLSRYVLVTPPAMSMRFKAHGGVPEPTLKQIDGWSVREWRMADLPVRQAEPASPGPTESNAWLDISTIPSWQHIVRWYRDLAQPLCVPDAAIRAKAAELTREARTPDEKLRALTAFVAREIQYQSTPFRNSAYVPTSGRQVLRESYGDCKDKAALLTALLDAVGIKANMVLLSGRSLGLVPYLPSPRFNHAIARVMMPDGPVWIDATADQLEFGGLPTEDQGVPALVIDEATTDLVLTPTLPLERNRLTDSHVSSLGEDDKLTGRMELSARGDWAWMLRSVLRLVPEAQREETLRGMAAEMMEGARCEGGSVEHLTDPDRPLVLSFKYAADNYSSSAGAFLLVRLPWRYGDMSSFESLLSSTTREQDVEMIMIRGSFASSVTLELPAGYVPQDQQPEVKGESPWGDYRITYRLDGSTLHARRELRLTPLRVPAAEFPQFLEFLRAIDRETRRQLVLKKAGGVN